MSTAIRSSQRFTDLQWFLKGYPWACTVQWTRICEAADDRPHVCLFEALSSYAIHRGKDIRQDCERPLPNLRQLLALRVNLRLAYYCHSSNSLLPSINIYHHCDIVSGILAYLWCYWLIYNPDVRFLLLCHQSSLSQTILLMLAVFLASLGIDQDILLAGLACWAL